PWCSGRAPPLSAHPSPPSSNRPCWHIPPRRHSVPPRRTKVRASSCPCRDLHLRAKKLDSVVGRIDANAHTAPRADARKREGSTGDRSHRHGFNGRKISVPAELHTAVRSELRGVHLVLDEERADQVARRAELCSRARALRDHLAARKQ